MSMFAVSYVVSFWNYVIDLVSFNKAVPVHTSNFTFINRLLTNKVK